MWITSLGSVCEFWRLTSLSMRAVFLIIHEADKHGHHTLLSLEHDWICCSTEGGYAELPQSRALVGKDQCGLDLERFVLPAAELFGSLVVASIALAHLCPKLTDVACELALCHPQIVSEDACPHL